MGIRLFVGGHANYVQFEPQTLGGDRMFTAAVPPQIHRPALPVCGLLDSGAFTDPPTGRLTPEQALARQLGWEQRASERWSMNFRSQAIVSYDLLIDETWIAGERHKRRWGLLEADKAVQGTIEAAAYLSAQRSALAPRTLILSAQGVDAFQYAECADGVLSHAQPGDWFGFGGWCILGRLTRMLPVFWQTIALVLPMVVSAGLSHVHIFGVLWQPALAGLLYLADSYDLAVSTDSTAPVMACTRGDHKKSGARLPYWRDNVTWWRDALANLRQSTHYRKPPQLQAARQEAFL